MGGGMTCAHQGCPRPADRRVGRSSRYCHGHAKQMQRYGRTFTLKAYKRRAVREVEAALAGLGAV